MRRTLYKYSSVSSVEGLSRFLGLLEGKVYFSSPLHFNDPFELSAKVDPVEFSFLDGLSRTGKLEVERVFRTASPSAVSDAWKSNVGILCLTENPLNILMWSHYGGNHSGVCIGFDSELDPFGDAVPVRYSDERSRVSFTSTPDELVERVLLTKSKHWEYEKEWRVIKRSVGEDERDFYYDRFVSGAAPLDEICELISKNAGPGLYDFDVGGVRSIFFGARVSSQRRDEVVEFVIQNSPWIKLFDVELDSNYFWLNKKRIR